MRIQSEHNTLDGRGVYFSGLLPERFSGFYSEISGALDACQIEVLLLPHTKDIWCRDYMPVRIGKGEFVQFKYEPEYLRSKKLRRTKTNPATAYEAIGLNPIPSNIILDGGNVVLYRNKAIMTRQILKDNPNYSCKALESTLKGLLKIDDLIIIPWEPDDPFCHADGSVRFIHENLVVINGRHKTHPGYDALLRAILKEHGLSWIELPYSMDNDKRHPDSAVGNYVNFLIIGSTVLVPLYKGHEPHNQEAIEKLSEWFKKVVPIESTAIAKEGGVLNCVSWVK